MQTELGDLAAVKSEGDESAQHPNFWLYMIEDVIYKKGTGWEENFGQVKFEMPMR